MTRHINNFELGELWIEKNGRRGRFVPEAKWRYGTLSAPFDAILPCASSRPITIKFLAYAWVRRC
jgi:hypothetical protein